MSYVSYDESPFYWGSIAYASALVGDYQSVSRYLEEYLVLVAPEREYPFYNGESACVLLAALECASECETAANRLDPFGLFT